MLRCRRHNGESRRHMLRCRRHNGASRRHLLRCRRHNGASRRHLLRCRRHNGASRRHLLRCRRHNGASRRLTLRCRRHNGVSRRHSLQCLRHNGMSRRHSWLTRGFSLRGLMSGFAGAPPCTRPRVLPRTLGTRSQGFHPLHPGLGRDSAPGLQQSGLVRLRSVRHWVPWSADLHLWRRFAIPVTTKYTRSYRTTWKASFPSICSNKEWGSVSSERASPRRFPGIPGGSPGRWPGRSRPASRGRPPCGRCASREAGGR